MSTNEHNARLDQTVAGRLARLRTMPVETSRLDAMLRAQLPPNPEVLGRASMFAASLAWIGPLRAAAAMLLLVGVIALVLVSSSGPALAAPSDMAAVHQKLVAGEMVVTRVGSVEEAGRVLKQQWAQAPDLPQIPAEHVAACCLNSVKDRRIACLLLDGHDGPVSVVVGNAGDFRLPDGPQQVVNGVTYRVKASGKVNMVMTEHADRLVCVMGEADPDRLIELAAELRF